MFGIPCGGYCFSLRDCGERTALVAKSKFAGGCRNNCNSQITNSTRRTSSSQLVAGYEEIELQCHNNPNALVAELLYHRGRYYRPLPHPAARSNHLKLQLPVSRLSLEAPLVGSHTNEQLNRISIIELTEEEAAAASEEEQEPPVSSPLEELVDSSPGIEGEEEEATLADKQLVCLEPQLPASSEERESRQKADLERIPAEVPALVESIRAGSSMAGASDASGQRLDSAAPLRVMISYVHAEAQSYALKLKEELKRVGVSVYLDLDEIEKGADWQDSLNQAVQSCQAFVPLVTPSYGSTLWTGREIKLADLLEKQIIPVNFGQRWPPAALAIQFATIQYISWLAPDAPNQSSPGLSLNLFDLARKRSGRKWPRSRVRSVARQIKQAMESKFASSLAGGLHWQARYHQCHCRFKAINIQHDSGYWEGSPAIPASLMNQSGSLQTSTNSYGSTEGTRARYNFSFDSTRLSESSGSGQKVSGSETDGYEEDVDEDQDQERDLQDHDSHCSCPDSERSFRKEPPRRGSPQPTPPPAETLKKDGSKKQSKSKGRRASKRIIKFLSSFPKHLVAFPGANPTATAQ